MSMVQQFGNVKIDSGYLTIDADAEIITVNHNLGVVPNFAAIWVNTNDYDIIPLGSCVAVICQQMQYATETSQTNTDYYSYMYNYKHATSGNLLKGTYQFNGNNMPTNSVFNFVRGSNNWKKLDTNNNLLKYKWVVGYFPDET